MPYLFFNQIKIGPLIIYTWGLMVGLGFIFAGGLFLWQAKKKGIDEKKILNLIFFLFLGAIFGSRFFYILARPFDYLTNPAEIFKLSQPGMTFYGGFLFALVFGWFYIKKNNLNFWQIADMAALAIPLGIFFGRLGCFLVNDHRGTLTKFPWGIVWPDGSVRHPVALYLSLMASAIFLILLTLRTRLKKQGQLFAAFLLLDSGSRFILDFFRADDACYLGLTVSQWLTALIILILLLVLFFRKLHRERFLM